MSTPTRLPLVTATNWARSNGGTPVPPTFITAEEMRRIMGMLGRPLFFSIITTTTHVFIANENYRPELRSFDVGPVLGQPLVESPLSYLPATPNNTPESPTSISSTPTLVSDTTPDSLGVNPPVSPSTPEWARGNHPWPAEAFLPPGSRPLLDLPPSPLSMPPPLVPPVMPECEFTFQYPDFTTHPSFPRADTPFPTDGFDTDTIEAVNNLVESITQAQALNLDPIRPHSPALSAPAGWPAHHGQWVDEEGAPIPSLATTPTSLTRQESPDDTPLPPLTILSPTSSSESSEFSVSTDSSDSTDSWAERPLTPYTASEIARSWEDTERIPNEETPVPPLPTPVSPTTTNEWAQTLADSVANRTEGAEWAGPVRRSKIPRRIHPYPPIKTIDFASIRCGLCNAFGHRAISCKYAMRCEICDKVGHIKDNCPQRRGRCWHCRSFGHQRHNCPSRNLSRRLFQPVKNKHYGQRRLAALDALKSAFRFLKNHEYAHRHHGSATQAHVYKSLVDEVNRRIEEVEKYGHTAGFPAM